MVVLISTSCVSHQRRKQLQRVAKDWCETIRASQIVPVYPPTADLVPGDVFLVEESIAEQHEAFEERGFLPLPYHRDRIRLTADTWDGMYRDVNDPLHAEGMPGIIGANRDREQVPDALGQAFGAAFPAYTFNVKNGGAFDLAIPISGVPVGVSVLGAAEATGSVTMKRVRTYGVGSIALAMEDIARWSRQPEVRRFLEQTYDAIDETNGCERPRVFVRVVSRVYGVREFDVSLSASSMVGVGVTAGIDTGDLGTRAENEQEILESLNTRQQNIRAAIAGVEDGANAIGGKLRFTSASSRSISLVETFDEPLVVGYIGLDMEVLKQRDLGPPIPTFSVIEQERQTLSVPFLSALNATARGREILKAAMRDSEDRDRVARALFRAAQVLGRSPQMLSELGLADGAASQSLVASLGNRDIDAVLVAFEKALLQPRAALVNDSAALAARERFEYETMRSAWEGTER